MKPKSGEGGDCPEEESIRFDWRGGYPTTKLGELCHASNERDFPKGLLIPVDETGAKACLGVVESNLADQVKWWLHSYVSTIRKRSFCV